MTIAMLDRAPLTIADRCDRCGAQAFFRAVFRVGELTFCGHHGRAFQPQLEFSALFLHDATDAINPKPSPSANCD